MDITLVYIALAISILSLVVSVSTIIYIKWEIYKAERG